MNAPEIQVRQHRVEGGSREDHLQSGTAVLEGRERAHGHSLLGR